MLKCAQGHFTTLLNDPMVSFPHLQVRFINLIPMQFFHKSLHTPLCIPTSAARYPISKILIITTGINRQSMLNLPVKAITENIAQQKLCGKMNLS